MLTLSYAEEQAVRSLHTTSHHHVGEEMFSTCECGWKSRPLHWSHSYQLTQSKQDGTQHVQNEVTKAKESR